MIDVVKMVEQEIGCPVIEPNEPRLRCLEYTALRKMLATGHDVPPVMWSNTQWAGLMATTVVSSDKKLAAVVFMARSWLAALSAYGRQDAHDLMEFVALHELAHVIAERRHKHEVNHGPEWERACAELGISDEQYIVRLDYDNYERAFFREPYP